MNTLRLALLSSLLGLTAQPLFAAVTNTAPKPPVHLEMDMTSEEYRALTKGMDEFESSDPLTAILSFGKRNLDWLSFINASRDANHKLELSTPATQVGYPIEGPTFANRAVISRDWNTAVAALPQVVKAVILEGKDFTTNLGMSDAEFLTTIRLLDKLYQRASRWLLQEPYLEYYAQAAADDIRGYYYLQREPDLDVKLTDWANLDDATKSRLAGFLVSQCRNTGIEEAVCRSQLAAAPQQPNGFLNFHHRYVEAASAHFNSYFQIQGDRSDVTWTGEEPNVLNIPFKNPRRDDVLAWLRDNIQDEWHWNDWQLKLNFMDEGDDNMTHVVFEAGATPHVNDIAGSEITMDGNRSIQEYSSRWTIRHEYGHVLGFPDCYLEFYDTAVQQMVQYQLDISNLMCSRTGHLQQKHFDELKRVYFRP